jgi:hypothetical protein
MHHVRSRRPRPLLTLALLGILAHGSASLAQELEDDAAPPAPAAKAAGPRRVRGTDDASLRARWEGRLSAEVERIDRTCRLSAAQKKKLELAGRGDIKRCFDAAGDTRSDPEAASALSRRLEEDLFRSGTIFAKTLAATLDRDQLARYRTERRERRRLIHRARVEVAVAILDETAGCTDLQRERLATLLMERTRLSSTQSDEDVALILAQAAALPEAQLRPIFDDSQWRAVSRLLKKLDEALNDQLRRAVLEPDDQADRVAVEKVKPTAAQK